MVVVDETVFSLYGDAIESYFEHHGVVKLLVLPTTEENKNMELVLKIAEAIHDLGIDRRLDPVIAIGGGVYMDIVGFAASIYRRCTPYVRVPTTLGTSTRPSARRPASTSRPSRAVGRTSSARTCRRRSPSSIARSSPPSTSASSPTALPRL